MKVLVIGRGGREHSIALKLAQSVSVSEVIVAPGNAGIEEIAKCVDIDEMDTQGLIELAKAEAIDLTIVGPEAPLAAGIANEFIKENLRVFAPTKEAAIIEGSKDFAKQFMVKYDIPTADFETFTHIDDAKEYVKEQGAPIVIKADGLAAGKGVVVAQTEEEAYKALEDMLVSEEFAEAGSKVVIEEFLEGEEFSLMALVHGNQVYPLVTARDHKRAFDNDLGPNTGGMGAYAPVDDVTKEDLAFSIEQVVQRAADGLVKEGRSFTGILYAGLMNTKEGPKVIEFNARFGDPETQVILPLMDNDFGQVLDDILNDKNPELQWKDEYCLGVVVASEGYPGSYNKGVTIPQISEKQAFVIHAGTSKQGNHFISNGGRVLLVGAQNKQFQQARNDVYKALEAFDHYNGFFYRKDIGMKKATEARQD